MVDATRAEPQEPGRWAKLELVPALVILALSAALVYSFALPAGLWLRCQHAAGPWAALLLLVAGPLGLFLVFMVLAGSWPGVEVSPAVRRLDRITLLAPILAGVLLAQQVPMRVAFGTVGEGLERLALSVAEAEGAPGIPSDGLPFGPYRVQEIVRVGEGEVVFVTWASTRASGSGVSAPTLRELRGFAWTADGEPPRWTSWPGREARPVPGHAGWFVVSQRASG